MTRMVRQPGNLQTLVGRQQWRRAAPEFHQIPCIPVVVQDEPRGDVNGLAVSQGRSANQKERASERAWPVNPALSPFRSACMQVRVRRCRYCAPVLETHAETNKKNTTHPRTYTHKHTPTHTHIQQKVNASSLRPRVHREGLVAKAYLNDLSHGLASTAPQWTPKCHSLQVQSNTRLRQSWASSNPMLRAERARFRK